MVAQGAKVRVERVNLLLEGLNMSAHLFEFIRVLEAVAAVWRVHTLQRQIAASLTRRVAIALDLPPLALVARD